MDPKNLIINFDSSLLMSYNIRTQQTFNHHILYKLDSPRFFDQFQHLFDLKQIKIFEFTFDRKDFTSAKEEYNFRQKCKEFCDKHKIYCAFPFSNFIVASTAISNTKTMVKEGEHVLIILSNCSHDTFGLTTVLKRENNCYRIVKLGITEYSPFTQPWKDYMFKGCNPKKVILAQPTTGSNSEFTQRMKNFFGKESFDSFFFDDRIPFFKQSLENFLHLKGEKINLFAVRTPCTLLCKVSVDGKTLIETSFLDVSPFEQSVVIEVDHKSNVSLFGRYAELNYPWNILEEIKLSTFKSNKVKVIIKLDINSFYDFKVEPFGENEKASKKNIAEENVAGSSSDKHVEPDKAQIVFEKQHFSVSYFANGKEYNLNDSNGLNKTPIYISFHEKKPIIGKTAMKIYGEKPKFVVFDLIKLCSVLTDDIFNPKWGFRLSKESESLFVIMETFDDEKKSTVEFLLAIILKEGKDRIKKETGKRMKEIEIKFDGFSPNEILKKNFIEAGKLLKINILFV